MPRIELNDISVRYGEAFALRDVSATIGPGTVLGIVGANGSGKTTLLRVLSGQTAGMRLSGSATGDSYTRAFCPDSRLAFQDLSAVENLELLGLALDLPGRERSQRISTLVSVLGFSRFADRPLRDLSLGMRRRVDIGLVLCRDADLYLFDEPFNGLDAQWTHSFSVLIGLLAAAGRSVVVASHALDLLLPLCTNVWELESGALIQALDATRAPLAAASLRSVSSLERDVEPLPWVSARNSSRS